MSDDKGKPASIPAWQRSQKPLGSGSQSQENSAPGKTTGADNQEPRSVDKGQVATPDEASVQPSDESAENMSEAEPNINQVRKFLEDPKVRTAPDDKKRAFLESRGVSKEMIDEVLVSVKATGFDAAEFKSRIQAQSPATQQQPRPDVPPIVTYPEFLVKPQKPPPLVTVNRLLNTAYVAGGLGAAFYGLSKFIIEPMTENLTSARHDLYQHRQQQIDTLNEKLSSLVSKIPPTTKPNTISPNDADSDSESITSDPTELFHRDIGTQTDLATPIAPIISSSASSQPTQTATEKQEARLKIVLSHLNEICDGSDENTATYFSVEGSFSDLRKYVQGLLYPISDATWGAGGGVEKEERKKEDAVAALRADIRGVKGVLLSAKRFPAAQAR